MMIGASHRSVEIAFREVLARTVGAQRVMESLDSAREAAILSTCNRFELYVASTSPEETSDSFFKAITDATGFKGAKDAFYQARDAGAAKHLFRVATGLESVVLGEPQVLAQVRAAGIRSRKFGTAGAILAPLFDRAFRVGSRVRADYGFGTEEASLSDLAVEAVRNALPGEHDVLLVGTGKMIRLAARKLSRRANRIFIITRRRTPPEGLEGAVLIPYSGIRKAAATCDIIISATSANIPILKEKDLEGQRRKLVVDLGMPRNVSPKARRLPNVHLVDLDDLAMIAKSRKSPPGLKEVETVVAREADAFYDWLVQTRLSSALADLYSWADDVRKEELRRALARLELDTDREKRVLDAMGRRIVSKLLARPTNFARRRHGTLSEEEKLELFKSVFEADTPDER